ncbi:hypothetical protein ADUPG1_009298, partial [Aduncisulcus paluster]
SFEACQHARRVPPWSDGMCSVTSLRGSILLLSFSFNSPLFLPPFLLPSSSTNHPSEIHHMKRKDLETKTYVDDDHISVRQAVSCSECMKEQGLLGGDIISDGSKDTVHVPLSDKSGSQDSEHSSEFLRIVPSNILENSVSRSILEHSWFFSISSLQFTSRIYQALTHLCLENNLEECRMLISSICSNFNPISVFSIMTSLYSQICSSSTLLSSSLTMTHAVFLLTMIEGQLRVYTEGIVRASRMTDPLLRLKGKPGLGNVLASLFVSTWHNSILYRFAFFTSLLPFLSILICLPQDILENEMVTVCGSTGRELEQLKNITTSKTLIAIKSLEKKNRTMLNPSVAASLPETVSVEQKLFQEQHEDEIGGIGEELSPSDASSCSISVLLKHDSSSLLSLLSSSLSSSHALLSMFFAMTSRPVLSLFYVLSDIPSPIKHMVTERLVGGPLCSTSSGFSCDARDVPWIMWKNDSKDQEYPDSSPLMYRDVTLSSPSDASSLDEGKSSKMKGGESMDESMLKWSVALEREMEREESLFTALLEEEMKGVHDKGGASGIMRVNTECNEESYDESELEKCSSLFPIIYDADSRTSTISFSDETDIFEQIYDQLLPFMKTESLGSFPLNCIRKLYYQSSNSRFYNFSVSMTFYNEQLTSTEIVDISFSDFSGKLVASSYYFPSGSIVDPSESSFFSINSISNSYSTISIGDIPLYGSLARGTDKFGEVVGRLSSSSPSLIGYSLVHSPFHGNGFIRLSSDVVSRKSELVFVKEAQPVFSDFDESLSNSQQKALEEIQTLARVKHIPSEIQQSQKQFTTEDVFLSLYSQLPEEFTSDFSQSDLDLPYRRWVNGIRLPHTSFTHQHIPSHSLLPIISISSQFIASCSSQNSTCADDDLDTSIGHSSLPITHIYSTDGKRVFVATIINNSVSELQPIPSIYESLSWYTSSLDLTQRSTMESDGQYDSSYPIYVDPADIDDSFSIISLSPAIELPSKYARNSISAAGMVIEETLSDDSTQQRIVIVASSISTFSTVSYSDEDIIDSDGNYHSLLRPYIPTASFSAFTSSGTISNLSLVPIHTDTDTDSNSDFGVFLVYFRFKSSGGDESLKMLMIRCVQEEIITVSDGSSESYDSVDGLIQGRYVSLTLSSALQSTYSPFEIYTASGLVSPFSLSFIGKDIDSSRVYYRFMVSRIRSE